MPRARKQRFSLRQFAEMDDSYFRQIGMGRIAKMLEGNSDINRELAARQEAMLAQVEGRKNLLNRRADEPLPTAPYIAGYTNMANASPEMRMQGYLEWVGKSPQQRYEDSALGAMDTMSMEGPSPGKAVLEDMAFGNSYWAGLARNIATGSPLPEAHLPRMDAEEGQPWSDPRRTSPMGEAAMNGSVERLEEMVPQPQQRQNTYTGFAHNNPVEGIYQTLNQQTQSPEGITRTAMADKTARELAVAAQTDEESNEAFVRYMAGRYGMSNMKDIQFVWDRLMGNTGR